jgi:AcrR family transcriptional regulator
MKADLTLDGIVQAATEMALARGIDGVSLRPLATRLGVTATAIYYHVKDKTQLLEMVAKKLFEPISMPDPSLPWTAQMRAFLLSQNELLHNVPGLARFLIERRDCEAALIWRQRLSEIVSAAGFENEARDAALSVFSFYIDPTTLISATPGEKLELDITLDHRHPDRTYVDYYRLGLDRLLDAFDHELQLGGPD